VTFNCASATDNGKLSSNKMTFTRSF